MFYHFQIFSFFSEKNSSTERESLFRGSHLGFQRSQVDLGLVHRVGWGDLAEGRGDERVEGLLNYANEVVPREREELGMET